MELFIPTLVVLLLSALACFYVLPRLSPYILGILSLAMLVVGIWQNYTMFPAEYAALTSIIKDYSGFAVVLILIGLSIGAINHYHGSNLPSPLSIMPAVSLPNLSGSSNSIFNLGGTSSSGPLAQVTNVLNDASTTISNVLKTPVNAFNNLRRNRGGLASTGFTTV